MADFNIQTKHAHTAQHMIVVKSIQQCNADQ